MGFFKSIEEFAKYVGKEFLAPPFYITKIINTGKKHPTNYAEVEYNPTHATVGYDMVKDRLRLASIANGTMVEELDREWWDTNHLYYSGKDIIAYISKKDTDRYEFWVLNMDGRVKYPPFKDGARGEMWLNKYNIALKEFITESDESLFYKIPIKKAPLFDFINWKDSPLKEN